jgi:hypothetical protein
MLGCILTAPEQCLPKIMPRLTSPQAFYDLRHQTIYETMCSMADNGGIDLITLQQKLKQRNQLEEVGGLAYLSCLPNATPSAGNLDYYLDIVVEKYRLRSVLKVCTEIVGRVYESENIESLLASVDADFQSVLQPASSSQESWSIAELSSYDTKHDPNAVIGYKDGLTTRYLCRGYGAWIIGQSGIGKSAITHQQAYLFSLGLPFCGITPVFPCRVLIVQSENDIGDNAETAQGILASIPNITPAVISKINQSVKVVRCRGKTGKIFCQWLQQEIKSWKADLCYVDPLLRFAGIDVSRQDQCTQFLNNCLDPVLANTGVVLIGAHHTGKPKGQNESRNQTIYDKAYAGIGSSELVNWARAVTIIEAKNDGSFEMLLAKRGGRSWATHPNGDPTTTIYLAHAPDKIFWVQNDPPEFPPPSAKGKAPGRKSKIDEIAYSNLFEFCIGCKPEGEGLNDIAARLEHFLAKNRIDASLSTCKRIIPILVSTGKIEKGIQDSLYRKGKEA